MAAPTEAGTDSTPVHMATSLEAFLIAFEAAFDGVHKSISLSHGYKKEETLRLLPESLLPESIKSSCNRGYRFAGIDLPGDNSIFDLSLTHVSHTLPSSQSYIFPNSYRAGCP